MLVRVLAWFSYRWSVPGGFSSRLVFVTPSGKARLGLAAVRISDWPMRVSCIICAPPRDVKVLRALSTVPRGSGQIPALGIRQRRSGKLELPASTFWGVISYHQPTPQCGNAHYSMASSQAPIRCDMLRCVAPDSEVPSPGIKTVNHAAPGYQKCVIFPISPRFALAPAISSLSLSPRNIPV